MQFPMIVEVAPLYLWRLPKNPRNIKNTPIAHGVTHAQLDPTEAPRRFFTGEADFHRPQCAKALDIVYPPVDQGLKIGVGGLF